MEQLTAYLNNPLAVDPSGRMPHVPLQGPEVADLARYLCQAKDDKIDAAVKGDFSKEQALAAFQRLESDAQAVKAFAGLGGPAAARLGKRLVGAKGCVNCHTVAPGGKTLTAEFSKVDLAGIREAARQWQGCLAEDAAKRVPHPHSPSLTRTVPRCERF